MDETSDDERVTAFLRAVGEGRGDDVRAMLAAAPGLVDAVGPHPFWGGRPQALHVAVEAKRADMVVLLLDAGADPAGRNEAYANWSPVMLACSRDRRDLAELLLAHGAPCGLPEALLLGDDRRAGALLADGLPVSRWGPLLSLARTPAAVDLLFALGADPDEADQWGATPLDAWSGLGAAGRPLLARAAARGVPVAARHLARTGDRQALAACAPAARADPDVLLAAVDSGEIELVRWLLDQGIDVNGRTAGRSRQTALHNAAWNGDLDMVRLLVEAGADLQALDDEHRAPPRGWAITAVRVANRPAARAVADWLAARGG